MPAKSVQRGQNKKLTDFFTQKPSATSSSPAPATTVTRASKLIDRESSANSGAPFQTRNASTTTTRKRARSPDYNNHSKSFPPKLQSPPKPKRTFPSDLLVKRSTAVVYVTSPFRKAQAQSSAPVQAPNTTLVTPPSNSSKQVVCSSQSDEAELVLSIPEPRDPGKVAEGIHVWRQKASEFSHSSSQCGREDVMELDIPPSSPTSARSSSSHFDMPVRSAVMARGGDAFRTPIATPACLPSPDTDEFPPLPPTPEPVDSEAKTAKLIAEIKARAFAATQSSDDERPLEFRELEDSDDDDLIDDLPLIGNAKEPSPRYRASRTTSTMLSSPLSSVPSIFNDTTIGHHPRIPEPCSPSRRSTRTSTRAYKPAVAFRLPVTIAESSSIGKTKSRSSPSIRRKSKTINPLEALIREKELEDRRGTSCAALRLAEEAIKEGSREASIGSDDEFDAMYQSRFRDEQAAWKAVYESRESASPGNPSDMENFAVGDRESKMLGAVAGAAINKILIGDKARKGKERAQNTTQKTTLGVPLWMEFTDEDMEVDSVPVPPLSGHPLLTCLDDCLTSGDDSLLDLIVRTGALAAVPTDVLVSNIPQLLDVAIFASSHTADGIRIALRDLWGLKPHKVQLPFTAILFILVRLGASPLVLEGLGFITNSAQKDHATPETLLEAVKRLLGIVKAAGFAGAFSSDDIASVVLILVVLGLDPLTSSTLRTELTISIDVVCNHGVTDIELLQLNDIHEKVSNFARQLSPINKARLVTFFAGGSGRTRCIARRLAYCLLISSQNTPTDQAPPLEPLVLLLSPDASSCELFDVTSSSTDYEELGHYVDILSVALIDIVPYVEEERASMKSATSPTSKFKKPPVPPLELLRRVLEVLQSKIVDTRAAHLDRSRTKAAIQRLTMRICYDRMALMGVRPRRRESTLKAYFSPQRP